MNENLPNGWNIVKLGEFAEIIMGQSPPSDTYSKENNGLPFFQGKTEFGRRHPKIKMYCSSPKKTATENDILMSVRAPVGPVNIAQNDCCIGRGLCAIRTSDKLDFMYLYHFLKANEVQISSKGTGSTFKAINKKTIHELEIPLPPIQTQKKIVAILEKAERLKVWRKEADELTDEFLKSTFLEMFGDLNDKNKGWEMSNLNDVCEELYRYPTFYGFDYLEKGVPIVRIMNILLNGSLDPNISNYVFFDPLLNKKFPRTILEFNDIVMAVRGDGSTAKRIGLVDNMNITGANISPNLIRFKANKKLIHPLYLFKFMTSDVGQTLLQKSVTRTAKKNITAGNIKKIPVPLPPLEHQQKFASIVQQVEQLREHQSQSRQHIDNLFNVLMQKAFKGELV